MRVLYKSTKIVLICTVLFLITVATLQILFAPKPEQPVEKTWYYITTRNGDTFKCDAKLNCELIIDGLWEKPPRPPKKQYDTIV